MDVASRKESLRRALEADAFVPGTVAPHASRQHVLKNNGWLFDLRAILLRSETLEDIAALFWDTFATHKNIQIGSIESAGISLATALTVIGARDHKRAGMSGFYIRKSRKKDGLLKMIEGTIRPDSEVVLVDDLINSGKSLVRQVEIIEGLGRTVHAIWTIIRFRDPEYYEYFAKKNIPIYAVFELNDFKDTLDLSNLVKKDIPSPLRQSFKVLWKFSSADPSYQYVVPKSDPIVDRDKIYMGSDSGIFWALNQADGTVAWSYATGFHPKGKGIFSSPAIYRDLVYFGAYDGNFYALDRTTGKKRWMFMDADWIGSSPAIADDLGILFVGLEFGLWRKRGGIVALNANNGKKLWDFKDMPAFTHSSPLYIREYSQVIIGSNDGCAYLFDARSGKLIWKYASGAATQEELDSGFGDHDIKASFAYDAKRDVLIFGNTNGDVCFVERANGIERGRFKADFGLYSTPVIYMNTVFCTSLDKHLYCIDLDTYTLVWKWNAGARIFATPAVIHGKLYIGANTGRLTELDPRTGKEVSSLVLTERITNRLIYSDSTGKFFLPTFANELYCLERMPEES